MEYFSDSNFFSLTSNATFYGFATLFPWSGGSIFYTTMLHLKYCYKTLTCVFWMVRKTKKLVICAVQ